MLTMQEWREAKHIVRLQEQGILTVNNMSDTQLYLLDQYQKEQREFLDVEDWDITDTDDTEYHLMTHNRQWWENTGGGGHNRYGGPYTPAPHRDPKGCPNGVLHVIAENGGLVGAFHLRPDDAWYFRNAMMAYPEGFHTKGDTMIVDIPEKHAKITTTAPAFSSCTFDSCKDYLEAVWGRKLHTSDKDWLLRHPFSEGMGVPQEYTPITASELVKPYGMSISRIRVKANAFFTGEALQQWQRALGCNPFALLDHATTNKEAAEKLGLTLEEANAMWRFDFDEWPLRPSVLGERQDATPSMVQGKRGGHARYLAPRDGNGPWFVCYQLLPSSEVAYNEPIVYPEYKAREDELTLLLYQTKGPNGVGLDDRRWYDQWVEAGMPGKTEALSPTTTPPATESAFTEGGSGAGSSPGVDKGPVDGEYDPSDQISEIIALSESGELANAQRGAKLKCMFCDKWHPLIEMVRGINGCCLSCYGETWSDYYCPFDQCQLQFALDEDKLPIILERKGKSQYGDFKCPRCQGKLGTGKDVNLKAMAYNIWGKEAQPRRDLPDKPKKGKDEQSQSSLELVTGEDEFGPFYYGE